MQAPRSRTVLLRGGSVYSPGAPFATAMLIEGDRIAWIGEEEAAAGLAASADEVVELEGRLVTPGFVDAHVHLAMTGFALASADLGPARSLVEALDLLATHAASHPGTVLYAHGWDETRWPEERAPNRTEVDRAVGDRPAYVARVDSHSAVVSSALVARVEGLEQSAGWSDDGRVERDAHHAVRHVVHGLYSDQDRLAAIERALRHAASRGITSVHELNAPHIAPHDDFGRVARLAREHALPEVVGYWGALWPGDGGEAGVAGFAGDLCMDGAIGSRTAAMRAPYADAETSGHRYLDRAQVRDHVVACTRAGLQAGFHVIGDDAVDEVVAGLESASDVVGVDAIVAARHRLEHVEMPDEAAIAAIARLGVVASVQPVFDAAWGGPGELYELRLGGDRAGPMNPFGSLLAAGIGLAFGSDSPITPLDPWAAVRAAMFHHREEERLTARAAFNAHTRGGHRARRDDAAGVLGPGAAATYAVWELAGDLTVQTPDARVAAWSTDARAGVPVLPDLHPELALPVCRQTVVAGKTVFNADTGRSADALSPALASSPKERR